MSFFKRTPQLEKLLSPGKYAELAAKETSDKTPLLNSNLAKKTATIAGTTGGGLAATSSLIPEDAEAGIKGSALPRKQLGEKYKNTLREWTEYAKNEARDALQNIFEEDPSGLAKKEMFRRLAKEGKISWNPELQEHQIRLYRGDRPEFLEERLYENAPLSWSPNPNVARKFGTKVYQTDLPLSKASSFLNVLPGTREFREEKEVITKPFKNNVEYIQTDSPSLLGTINKRINQSIPISELAKKKYGTELWGLSPYEHDLRTAYMDALPGNPVADKFQAFAVPSSTMSKDDLLTYFKKSVQTEDPLTITGNAIKKWGNTIESLPQEKKKFIADNLFPNQNAKDLFLQKLEDLGELVEDKFPTRLRLQKQSLSNGLNGLKTLGVISQEEKNFLLDELVNRHRSQAAERFAKNANYKLPSSMSSDPKLKQKMFDLFERMLVESRNNLELTPTEYVAHRKQLHADFGLKDLPNEVESKKAAAIGGAAIGAGALASSSSAHANEGPTVSQSNPEFSSNTRSNVVKDATSEEQEKSKLLKALEGYGTAARSAASSATLGVSEPVVSGLSAAVGTLISAGFDAKDALDFVKKATDPELFKKEYESDIEYRKQMQAEHPIADIGGSLVGAFSPVGPAATISRAIGKGTAKAGEALYKAGALKKLSNAVGAPAARAIMKTGLAAGEGAAFIPAVSLPEQKIKELAGLSEPSEHSVFDELNEPSTLEEAESGAAIQGGVKSGVELVKLLKRLRR
jgi:hypothetical protein